MALRWVGGWMDVLMATRKNRMVYKVMNSCLAMSNLRPLPTRSYCRLRVLQCRPVLIQHDYHRGETITMTRSFLEDSKIEKSSRSIRRSTNVVDFKLWCHIKFPCPLCPILFVKIRLHEICINSIWRMTCTNEHCLPYML